MSERGAFEVMLEMIIKMGEYIVLLESTNKAISKHLLGLMDAFNNTEVEELPIDPNELTFFELNAGLFNAQKKDFRKDLKRLSDELDSIRGQ